MADFFAPGVLDLWIKFRDGIGSNETSPFQYLGTAVTAPEIDADITTTPFLADYNAPEPFQRVFNSEQHRVLVTLNRLNFVTWNRVKSGSIAFPVVRRFKPGKLVYNVSDFELLLSYTLPQLGSLGPPGTPRGRLYYSAVLSAYSESTVETRLLEITVLFNCNPLFFHQTKDFALYTEDGLDIPTLDQSKFE